MIGTPNIKRLLVLCGLALAGPAHGDDVILEGSSKLSGTVTSISDTSGVRLDSPLAAEPLVIRPGAVQRVLFATGKETPPPGGTHLKLVGGDILPCEVKSLDEATLLVSTSFAGELKVPRTAVTSLELGIHEQKPIYEGVDLEGWTNDRWSVKDGSYRCSGTARMARSFDLPEQFILRYTLAWRGSPNLTTTFADPLDKSAPDGGPVRYVLQFNATGLDLRRTGGPGGRITTILNLPKQSDSFPNSKMDIELRVDRTHSEIWLYIDHVLEGHHADPVKNPPKDGGISFAASNGVDQTLSNLAILPWDAEGERLRSEERGDVSKDALLTAKGDRYPGSLEAIRTTAGVTIFAFKSPLLEQSMSIPAKEISTVFFKTLPPPPPAANAKKPLVLRLHGGGSLKVESCSFSGTQVEARHAQLGALSLKRSAVESIEQFQTSAPTPDKE